MILRVFSLKFVDCLFYLRIIAAPCTVAMGKEKALTLDNFYFIIASNTGKEVIENL